MRDILFRGKRTDTGEWVQGDLVHGIGKNRGRMFIWSEVDYIPTGIDEFEVIPETVGQCVGEVFLADTRWSRTMIFEGDVLEVLLVDIPEKAVDYREPMELVTRRGVVRYHEDLNEFRLRIYKNGEYHMRIQLWSFGLKKLKVIGNVYDNPELLHLKGESK